MNLPLPKETKDYLGNNKNNILKCSNLYLLLNKYVYCWQNDWQMDEKYIKKFREDIENYVSQIKPNEHSNYIEALHTRVKSIVKALKDSGWHVEMFQATTESRLIIGLGSTSVIETGMILHPLFGFPYLPASGLKGLTRAYAEIIVEPKPSAEELREVFGSEDKDPYNIENNRRGKVLFLDGLPLQFPKLEIDIMNPHYSEYYQGKKDSKGNPIPPADYLNPIPVTFLTVKAGEKFLFVVYSKFKELARKAKEWFKGGLSELGAGGKTNVGYGYFKDFNDIEIQFQLDKFKISSKEVHEMMDKVKKIKNIQTFIEFINSIKETEIESLKIISFKGMESVINIGLTGILESIDTSKEIKKIIAQKILEICREPNKKYSEKVEKYNRLRSIAEL